MFEYLYYRLFIMYKKKEKESSGFSAVIVICMIQICIFFSLFVTAKMTFNGLFSDSLEYLKTIDKNKLKFVIVIAAFALFVIEYFYFRKKREKIILKYSNHPANKWFKPWMLYIFVIIILAIPYFYWQLLVLLGIR